MARQAEAALRSANQLFRADLKTGLALTTLSSISSPERARSLLLSMPGTANHFPRSSADSHGMAILVRYARDAGTNPRRAAACGNAANRLAG